MNSKPTQSDEHLSFKQKLNLVFDDNLHTHVWQNVADWTIISLIIISTIEVFLSTFESVDAKIGGLLNVIDLFTTIFFTIEVTLRIWCADLLDPKYKGFKGRLRYCLSFYGLIDILSTYTFYVALFFPIPYLALKALRVARLLRIFRYMKSFRLLSEAISSKKDELWVSLQFLCIVTVILSFLLFFLEHSVQPEVYDNGWTSVVWAFAQYIGDPGQFATTPPITFWGRIIAVLVGVMGIAIFAVPAGLIGSGFVEVIEQKRHDDEVSGNLKKINNRFDALDIVARPILHKDGWHRTSRCRQLSYDTVQTILMLTDIEIMEAVRSSDNIKMMARKSSPELMYNDMKVLERFKRGETEEQGFPYGFRRWDEQQHVCIVGAIGATEIGMSHVIDTIADNYPYNIIARQVRIWPDGANESNQGQGELFVDFKRSMADKEVPEGFKCLLRHYSQLRADDFVVMLFSGASGRKDFEVEWGMPKGTESIQFEGSHVAPCYYDKVQQFVETLQKMSQNVEVTGSDKKHYNFSFSVGLNSLGFAPAVSETATKKHLARAIYDETGASVVRVYLNLKTILQQENSCYLAALKVLMDVMEEVFSPNIEV